MNLRIVSVSPKGQLTIPVAILRDMGITGRTELAIVQEGDQMVIRPAATAAKAITDDLADWLNLSTGAFADVWDNEADEVWNDA